MAHLWMIFPARNLHLYKGFSMAMLNNQMVVSKWRILGISSGLTQYGQLQLGHCCILPPAPAGPPGGAMEAG